MGDKEPDKGYKFRSLPLILLAKGVDDSKKCSKEETKKRDTTLLSSYESCGQLTATVDHHLKMRK